GNAPLASNNLPPSKRHRCSGPSGTETEPEHENNTNKQSQFGWISSVLRGLAASSNIGCHSFLLAESSTAPVESRLSYRVRDVQGFQQAPALFLTLHLTYEVSLPIRLVVLNDLSC
ncbi:unnamed protein product, partial [Protopolystoma xenopodis]